MGRREILEWDYYIDGVKYWTMIDPNDGTPPKKRTVPVEIHEKVSVNNPCGHTGFESGVCEICGYPDPRKVIEALKIRIKELECLGSFTRGLSLLRRIKGLEAALEPIRAVWKRYDDHPMYGPSGAEYAEAVKRCIDILDEEVSDGSV